MLKPFQRLSDAPTNASIVRQSGLNWPKHQYENFYRLYITEDLNLLEVIRLLKEEHGFIVTSKQCKSKIREQCLKKYLKQAEMDKVAQEYERKRKAEDGQNAVIRFAGVEIRSQRIERYLNRKKRAKVQGEEQPELVLNNSEDASLTQESPIEPIEPKPKERSKSPEEKATDTNALNDGVEAGTILTITESLASLLKRMRVSNDTKKGKEAEAPGINGTIDLQQMILINKPQRHELDLLRHEWEKQRELTWHLVSKGRLKDAEYKARHNLAAQLEVEGVGSISTLGSINLLSYIHRSQTNMSEAKTYEWMYQSCMKVYGPQDLVTLDAKRDLAWVYQADKEEEKAHSLLSEILQDLVLTPKEFVSDIQRHFIDMSRATTDMAVLLCLQEKMTEADQLLGVLWSAVAYFTLLHKCSLRVASALGRKLAGMGEDDDAAFLLTSIVQSAVTSTGSGWGSYMDVSSHRVLAGRGEVGEILRAYEKHVLPQLSISMAILRKLMGFGTAKCDPVMSGNGIGVQDREGQNIVSEEDIESFNGGNKLIKR